MKRLFQLFSPALVLAFVLLQTESFAQTTATTSNVCEDCIDYHLPKNYVGGHRYSPSLIFPAPFITSSITFALSGGGSTQTTNILGTDRDLQLVTAAPIIDAQIAIFERLAISFGVNGSFTSGINAQSALLYGASLGYQFNAGALFNILHSRKAVLSFGLNVSKPKNLAVSPLVSLVTAVRGSVGASTTDNFSSQSESTKWRPTFRFVYTLNPTLGLFSVVGYQFVQKSTEDGSATSSQINLGIGADLQLKPTLNIPIGVQLSYLRGEGLTGDRTDSNLVLLGIFETISPRFNFGIEFGRVLTPRVDGFAGSIVARNYY